MYTGVFTGSCTNVYRLHIIKKKYCCIKENISRQVYNRNQTVFLTNVCIPLWLQSACYQLTTIERHITPSFN